MTHQCATHGPPTYRPLPTPTAKATLIVLAPHGAQAPARPATLAASTGRSPASHGIRIAPSARPRPRRILALQPGLPLALKGRVVGQCVCERVSLRWTHH